MDQMSCCGTFFVIKKPPFQLPDSQIKGLLSDMFEMNIIDAESFPVDEVSQELK